MHQPALAPHCTPERIYIAPHPALRGCISHYTVCTPHGGASALTIVPDASGSIVCRLAAGPLGPRAETVFWGPSSQAVVVESNPQKCPLYIMVEFLPCGAHRLLGLPMNALHNVMMPLHALHAGLHRTLAEQLEQLAAHVHHLTAVCASLDAAFLRLLAAGKDSRLARHVVDEVRRTNGTVRVAELARQLRCSPRQLSRILSERVGMPAKSLARIVRINAACRRMGAAPVSLTELAHSLQYHDQAHFIHDFSAVCGVTPGEYLRHLSHFYNEELKLGGILPANNQGEAS